MENTKITKAMALNGIIAVLNGESTDIPVEEMMNYCTTTLNQLAAKAEKAKSKAEEKKAANDELTNIVAGVLGTEFMNADEVTAAVAETVPDVTRGKVINRLSKLVLAEVVVKDNIKVGSSKKVAYKLA